MIFQRRKGPLFPLRNSEPHKPFLQREFGKIPQDMLRALEEAVRLIQEANTPGTACYIINGFDKRR